MVQQWEYAVLQCDEVTGLEFTIVLHFQGADGRTEQQAVPLVGNAHRAYFLLRDRLKDSDWEYLGEMFDGWTNIAYFKRPATGKPLLLDASTLGQKP